MINIQLSELDLSLEVADIDDLTVILDDRSSVGLQGPILFGPNPTALDFGQLELDLLGFPYRGQSAYELAVEAGFVGTLQDWLDSLVGPESPNADAAETARLAAVAAASEAESHASAASISVGTASAHADQAGVYADAAQTHSVQAEVYRDETGQSAAAAASSVLTASAHATDAGEFAEAALIDRVIAETSMSNAEIARIAAASSATSASGSAASASESATLAVEAQTAAGDSAAAALLSESAASSAADAASSYADASQLSQISATASREEAEIAAAASVIHRDSAEAYADDAGSSATAAAASAVSAASSFGDADAAATAAATSASSASTFADNASTSASSAATQATNAATSAGNASTSATQSSNSATTAAGHASNASTSAGAAATSAGAASGSATAASGSANTASTQATNAGNSATAAAASAVSAASSLDDAEDAAAAAATSASSASTSATNAGTAATAASNSAINASTSAGTAGTHATNAATSASTATTQANNASTSAGVAATNATNAGNSATAAGASATTAGTHATNAGNSATAANTSAVNAASSYANVIQVTRNGNFDQGTAGWVDGASMTLEASNSGRSNILKSSVGQNGTLLSQLIPITAGANYRASVGFRMLAGTGSAVFYVGAFFYDSAGTLLSATDGTGNYFLAGAASFNVAAGWQDRTALIGPGTPYVYGTPTFPAGTASIRLCFFFNYSGIGDAVCGIDYFTLETATAEVGAIASATAAATSASSASTSATNAGTSATAASTSATNASTSAGNAGTSATNAANSATTATTQANNASTSATTAATQATNASNSASAAGTSATTAGTHATNAGNSATAANSSAVSAASSFTNTVLVDGNQDFSNGFTGWYVSAGTTPTATASLGGRTNVLSLASGQAGQYRSTKRFPVDTSRKYKVSTEVYVGAGSGSAQFYVGFAAFDADGNALTHSPGSYAYAAILGDTWAANTGWVKRDSLLNNAQAPITGEGTGTWVIFPVGTRSIELLVLQNYNNSSCITGVNYVYWEDITDSHNAATSATSAATSASSASTSAGAAGVSATSAATQATNAEVSAGNAASSASTAATQASNASTSAASASSSAVTAANLSGSTANILRRSQFFTGNTVSDYSPWISGNNTLGATAGVYNYSTSWAPDGEFCLFTEAPNSPGSIHDWYSDVLPAEALKYYCLSAYVGIFNASTAGDVRVFIEFMNSAGTVLAYTGTPAASFCYSSDGKQGGTSLDNFKRIFVIGQAPATTAKMRAYIRRNNMGTASYTWVLRPMLSEASATMTAPPPFGPSNIASSVAVTQTAVASLNAQNTLARYEVSADTGGGTARLRLVSSIYGTSVKLDADKIFFGDNTTFDNAVDVLVTTTGSNSRIIAWGAAFGTDGQLTEWEGPSSVTWGNHSRANAYFYRANVAPYVGGSAIAAGFTVTSSNTSRIGTRTGAGSVTSNTVTLTPTNASGSVTYAWSRIYGDSAITATASTSAATAFIATVANGEEKQAMFSWTATDNAGKVQTGTVGVALISNA